jgi:hypothetical protein
MEKQSYVSSGFAAYDVVGPSSGKQNITVLRGVSIGSVSGLPRVAPSICFVDYLVTAASNLMPLRIIGWARCPMSTLITLALAM